MNSRIFKIAVISIVFLFLVDLYTFKGLKVMLGKSVLHKYSVLIISAHWLISIGVALFFIYFFIFSTPEPRSDLFTFFGIIMLIYIPKLVFCTFHLVEDVLYLGQKLVALFNYPSQSPQTSENPINRITFLTSLGAIISVIPFFSILYGITHGKSNFKIRRIPLTFTHLPDAFNGFKIVQFSDLHAGSIGNPQKYKELIKVMNEEYPDVIVFTGDLINVFAKELDEWKEFFAELTSKHKIAILGNHDYGDYHNWESKEAKQGNFNQIKKFYSSAGFKLLQNECIRLGQNGEAIALIGVENWGAPPFQTYGDYEVASKEVHDIPFKILFSHDPTHWEHKIKGKTDVALTLSGHTHGMQMGIRGRHYKWSPAKWRYNYWGGLYNENGQSLYVNVGLGYIGFPGRIGIWPEISIFKLQKK